MEDLFELKNESIDNLEYLNDVKKYWRDYFNARLAETTDPVKQQKILELLKEYV